MSAAPQVSSTNDICTERMVSCLLGNLSSQENVVALLSKSHPVFTRLLLQRKIIGYLASGQRPLTLVVGSEGAGKSFLLAEVERRARSRFPLLDIHATFRVPGSSSRNRAVNFLREILFRHSWSSELESLRPNEILHNGPSLLTRIALDKAGVILLIDDMFDLCGGELPFWLPRPLPPGLHCIATSHEDKAADATTLRSHPGMHPTDVILRKVLPFTPVQKRLFLSNFAPHVREVLQAVMCELLVTKQSVTPRICQLLAHLMSISSNAMQDGCELGYLCKRSKQLLLGVEESDGYQVVTYDRVLALAILLVCEESHGSFAVWVPSLISYSSFGLTPTDILTLCGGHRELPTLLPKDVIEVLEMCGPLLQTTASPLAGEHRYICTGDFALYACRVFCKGKVFDDDAMHRLLVLHFTTPLVENDPVREIEEVAEQLSKIDPQAEGASDMIVDFVNRTEVLNHFSNRADDLINIWRRASGASLRMKGSKPVPRAVKLKNAPIVGRLLTTAGEYFSSRMVLLQAAEAFASGIGVVDDRQRRHAEVLVLLAKNESQNMDSRRDGGTVEASKLLLDSSADAVRIMKQQPLSTMSEVDKELLNDALLSRANGCFKAGCLSASNSAQQRSYLGEADSCIAEAVDSDDPTVIGGVTKACRARSCAGQDQDTEALDLAISSLQEYYHAEAILRDLVGPMCENSISTHVNLADLFLERLQSPFLGLIHHRMGCIVAVRILGAKHPNAKSVIRELARNFHRRNWNDFESSVQEGRPEDVCPAKLARRLSTSNDMQGPNHVQVVNIMQAMSPRLPVARVDSSFWTGLWKDMQIPQAVVRSQNLPT